MKCRIVQQDGCLNSCPLTVDVPDRPLGLAQHIVCGRAIVVMFSTSDHAAICAVTRCARTRRTELLLIGAWPSARVCSSASDA
jgi:hypothetical protein